MLNHVDNKAYGGKHGTRAFTLVELAIVLVIIGLIVGGVLVGQSLIRAGEMRAMVSELQRYTAAMHTFRLKFNALPGDMNNATGTFGKDNAHCPTDTGTAATNGTCNGNGDGFIGNAAAANATGERFQFWKQLALAGLIEGSYTGIAGTSSATHSLLKTNVPDSKISQGGWTVLVGSAAGDPLTFTRYYGNTFQYGTKNPTGSPNLPIFRPIEARDLDEKMDDGAPAYGHWVARYWNNACTTVNSGVLAMTNLDASYRVTDDTIQCTFNIVM